VRSVPNHSDYQVMISARSAGTRTRWVDAVLITSEGRLRACGGADLAWRHWVSYGLALLRQQKSNGGAFL